jgi:DNA-directed RNA polymerase specialized sigma24 family protein
MTNSYLPESAKITKQRISMNPEALQSHFLAILPRIETHAQINFRHLKCPGKRDDAIQETIAIAWKSFLRITEQGKDVDEFVSTLADYAVRHVRSGRRLCGQLKSKDVFSPRAQHRGGFKVEVLACSTRTSLDALYADPQGQDEMDAMEERLTDNMQTPVPDQAAFRIDYPAWLSQLGARNREIAEDMTLDLGTLELADRHKMSPGRISQLRREFHADYKRFHGEANCV